ncbi:MAG: ABC transporter substrate-binding protein [Armatimonadetes bacterium]|nr:ABC transporter substrate-binding protein [Armatimonadota bacterium]
MRQLGTVWGLAALLALAGAGCKTSTGGGDTVIRPDVDPAATGNAVEGDVIKIGVIASLNGDLKPWGEDSVRGIKLAVEEFNAAGGLDGKMVELLIEDTASRAEQGKSATEKLIAKDKVVAIIGEIASGITQPSAMVAQQYGVPIISPGATRVDITQIGKAVFRACFTDNFQGAAMAKFAYEKLSLRRIAILTDKAQPYSTGLSDVFRAAFTQFGGEIVDEQFYEKGTLDFKPQLTNLRTKNPDGLFCSGYFNEVGPIARQRLVIGLDVPMIGGDGWDSRELLQSGGRGIIGSYFSNHYSSLEDREIVQRFVANFTDMWGAAPATAMGAVSYDAAGVLLDALRRAETLDSPGIIKAIQDTKDFPGVSGSITIGDDGNAEKAILVLEVTEEGFVPFDRIDFFVFEEK